MDKKIKINAILLFFLIQAQVFSATPSLVSCSDNNIEMTYFVHKPLLDYSDNGAMRIFLDAMSVCGLAYKPDEDCRLSSREFSEGGQHLVQWVWSCAKGAIKLNIEYRRIGRVSSYLTARCFDKDKIIDEAAATNCSHE